ncbi:hypothetical protein [Pseudomonas savastanoi]|uniref:hypothetical protein n=1 Tax=Pseudomonas savastanoi TaxID=29438 RepID=UPI000E326881|nr:hypothetical protein [Pseudomonas savastanoi]
MNKALVALAMMALASPAFADDDSIVVPNLTTLPFVVTNAGEMSSGYFKNWGSLSAERGTFTSASNRAVEQLQDHKCAVHFGVARNAAGRIDPKDGIVTIACMRQDGSVVATDVPGALVDSTGGIGLKTSDVGDRAFFLVQSAIRIPLVSE